MEFYDDVMTQEKCTKNPLVEELIPILLQTLKKSYLMGNVNKQNFGAQKLKIIHKALNNLDPCQSHLYQEAIFSKYNKLKYFITHNKTYYYLNILQN